MPQRKLPRTPYLNPEFAGAVDEFGIKLKKTASIQHSGIKGGAREDNLRDFLREKLPDRYGVVTGEAVDLNGTIGPELDIMIFDAQDDFAFQAGSKSILAAEALLASVEVKSKLTFAEINKSVIAAGKLRSLKPHNLDLGGVDVGNDRSTPKQARYLHCIFAYDTDIAESNWLQSEASRLRRAIGTQHLIDAVYVLNKGIINITQNRGRLEDEAGGAISNFYFSLLNFVQREQKRRRPTPYERYIKSAPKAWIKI